MKYVQDLFVANVRLCFVVHTAEKHHVSHAEREAMEVVYSVQKKYVVVIVIYCITLWVTLVISAARNSVITVQNI